jgi:hypothetical protein
MYTYLNRKHLVLVLVLGVLRENILEKRLRLWKYQTVNGLTEEHKKEKRKRQRQRDKNRERHLKTDRKRGNTEPMGDR